jgi:DNA invertase Pin-like site-specific DNA recombinase
MAKIGYARVSTRDQNPDHQIDALKAAGCERVFVDKASGKLARRPELEKALDFLRADDQLVVTRLNRLGRSLRHLIELVAQLDERGVDLVVLGQGIDTTTPGGRLLFHLMAAIAEFERELIVEGTQDGLEAARSRGRTGGRPAKLNARQVAQARRMYDDVDAEGSRIHTMTEVAETFGVSRATLYRHLEPAPDAPDAGAAATTMAVATVPLVDASQGDT